MHLEAVYTKFTGVQVTLFVNKNVMSIGPSK